MTTTNTCAGCGHPGGGLVGGSTRWHTQCALAAAERSMQPAITYPATWSPPPFQLGQLVYLRDSGNRCVQVIGLVHGGRADLRDDYWTIFVIESRRQITPDEYSVSDLSAEPLTDEDADYQDYRARGGTLDWTAWRGVADEYERLIPVMWQSPPQPPELAEIKRTLLIGD